MFLKIIIQKDRPLKSLLQIAALSFIAVLTTLSSCKNKGTAVTLSKEDSLRISKEVLQVKSKIYYMKLSAVQLKDLFTPSDPNVDPNAIKQIHFTWHSYPNNEYGLDAFGVDDKGNKLSNVIEVQIPNRRNYVTNWNDMSQPSLLVIRRGDIKYLLESGERGRNTPVETAKLADIDIDPLLRNYPDTESTMFFSLRKSGYVKEKSILAGIITYLNPSPPYNNICDGDCDY